MSEDLDALFAELGSISDRLRTLPQEARAERSALRGRQRELREKARALGRAETTARPEAARDRLRYLRAELDRRMQGRLSQSTGAQTGMGGGIDPKFVHRVNRAIDAAMDVEQLRAEIRRLETSLTQKSD